MNLGLRLLPLFAAMTLVACGDDSTPGADTRDTTNEVSPDVTPDVVPDVTPDVTPDVVPDVTPDVVPDVVPDVEPDVTPDVVPDSVEETTQDVVPDVEPDVVPDVTPDVTPDTVADTTPDTTGDTTPTTSTLAELMAPFATSANNFETTPNATVTGLVVTLVKPDYGTELGGFFALDPTDLTPVYFAPATGVVALPEGLEETSIISVTIGKIKNVSGMPMVTEYSALTVTGEVESLDEVFVDASGWDAAEWAGTQATYIDLVGTIVGTPVNAGGGATGYRRFGFTSEGLPEVNAAVNIRFPVELINYYAIEDGCEFDLIAGAVWAFRADTAGATTQYQPMFLAPFSFLLLCTPPVLEEAKATNETTVVLTFSRPMEALSMDVTSFTFDPALDVVSFELSDDLKTVTLTTATHAAPSYTVTVADDVVDTTFEPINADERTFTFETGTVAGVVIAGWDFGPTSPGTLTATAGIAANADKTVSTTATGTLSFPSGYLAASGGGVAASSNGWDAGVNTKAWVAHFTTSGYSNIVLATSRHGGSGTGPRDWKLQYSLDNAAWTDIADGAYAIPAVVSVNEPATWYSFVDFTLPSAIDNQANVYLRWVVTATTSINAGTVATTGTNRIDEVVIKGVPLP
jgi:hypothetical protein